MRVSVSASLPPLAHTIQNCDVYLEALCVAVRCISFTLLGKTYGSMAKCLICLRICIAADLKPCACRGSVQGGSLPCCLDCPTGRVLTALTSLGKFDVKSARDKGRSVPQDYLTSAVLKLW